MPLLRLQQPGSRACRSVGLARRFARGFAARGGFAARPSGGFDILRRRHAQPDAPRNRRGGARGGGGWVGIGRRSAEEGRVGKECVRTGRTGWAPGREKKKK